MKANTTLVSLLICGLAIVWLPCCLEARLIAYQSFTEGAGTENPDVSQENATGKPVGEGGSGFQKLKMLGKRQPLVVTSQGLSYQTGEVALSVEGNAIEVPGGISPMLLIYTPYPGDPFAELRSVEDPKVFGRPGTSLWLSCLMRVKGEISPSMLMVIKLGSSPINLGLAYNEKAAAPFIRLISSSTKVVGQDDHTYLFVARIEYGPKAMPGDRTDTIQVWIDPRLGTSEPPTPPQAIVDKLSAPFSGVWFERDTLDAKTTVIVDEIRLGESYADVTPVSK
ncbi:MAG: hypothetical protein B9S32_03660 [Verrucomicrobia bacterium Tous-C9LFEB]|nr:MAG: hypothetical protein B9S32_03660 [Verrucomicrobia bacterium Tous-C9LFEB]